MQQQQYRYYDNMNRGPKDRDALGGLSTIALGYDCGSYKRSSSYAITKKIQTVNFELPDGVGANFHVLLCLIVNGISFSISHASVATGHQVTVMCTYIQYRYTQSMATQHTQ